MRIVLATLLLVGAAGLTVVPPPVSFLVGALPILVAFFLSWMRFAIDLVDLLAAALVADLTAPAAVVLAFWLGTGDASTWLVSALLVAAAAAQAMPRIVRGRRGRPPPGDRAGDGAELGVPAIAEAADVGLTPSGDAPAP